MSSELIRRCIRYTLAGFGVVALATALAVAFLHFWGVQRLEKARSNFESRWGNLADFDTPPDVPGPSNAGRWLVAGGQAILCSLEDQRFFGRMAERPADGWTEAELARVRWILHEQQPALELLLRSARFDDFHLGRNGRRVHHEEIEVMNIVKGLRLLVLEARLADVDGRPGDAITALTTVGRAVDGLLKTPTVATWIIGSAATRWTAWAAADLVRNPCADPSMFEELRAALPTEDPLHAGDATLARAVIEVADEKLAYIENRNDPSVGWSVPFWIPNHFLFEDLIVAELVDRWDTFLELGQRPAAGWSIQDDHSDSLVSPWPGWFAMTGDYRPNLLSARSRAQAAASELQQLDLAVAIRVASPSGLDRSACELIDSTAATALTGGPVVCRYDERNSIIVLEIPGATDVLQRFSTGNNRVGYLPPIELPVGLRSELCPGL